MSKNVGSIDRASRGLVGIILIAVFFLGIMQGTLGIVSLAAGIVLLDTSVFGWCLAYSQLGINTCSVKESS